MRLFLAIEINDTARREIAALQDRLRRSAGDVKWVEPENLHLTLKFLGETDERQLPQLTETLEHCAAGLAPFSFQLEGVGAFPTLQHPRVIWVGVSKGKEPLVKLAEAVEKTCSFVLRQAQHERHPLTLRQAQGERPFSAHLTIGRVRSHARLETNTPFKTSEPILSDRLVLFQSLLSSQGPRYIPVAVLPFKPA